MSNIFKYKGKSITINRQPKSTNKSLRSWSAGDELALTYINENKINKECTALYNDKFGFTSCVLNRYNPVKVIDYKSQERAIISNLQNNQFEFDDKLFLASLDTLATKLNLAIIKVPKSLSLFQLHLQNIAKNLNEEGIVICSFMTKNFSKQMLEIASLYFIEIEQTKAWKKARLLILKLPKEGVEIELINKVEYKPKQLLSQYFGVFSANHIDYATQFLIDNLVIDHNAEIGLDLASGNGILAYFIRQKNPTVELHLVDDMGLAIESSKINLTDSNTYFHYNNSLEEFQNNFFDFIVCNPPFHFEYETNIEIPLTLFKEAKRCLKKDGNFQLVANQHLNYKTHLIKLFTTVEVVNENEKFIIYKCTK